MKLFDEVIASLSRPYIACICGSAIAACCFFPATNMVALPIAGGLVATYMGLRTMDKNISSKADVENKKTAAAANPPIPDPAPPPPVAG